MTDCQTPRHPAKSATYRYYSFAINNGPPPGASSAELVKFGQQNYATILWGAWLQAIGPVLIVLFAFALVPLGWSDAAPGGLDDLFRGHHPDDGESHRDHFLHQRSEPRPGDDAIHQS